MIANIQIILNTTVMGRLDLTEQTESFRFGTLEPGGWWNAEVRLLSPRREAWSMLERGALTAAATLEFWSMGERLWLGTVNGHGLSGTTLSISAEGTASRLRDTEVWRIFADAEFTRWSVVDTERFDVNTRDKLSIAAIGGYFYTAGDEGQITYPSVAGELGGTLVRIQAAYEAGCWGRTFAAELRNADAVVLWSLALDGNPTGVAVTHISAVGGQGDLGAEYIDVLNAGSLARSIADWKIQDDDGALLYTFGAVTMQPNMIIRVWSKVGTNDATNLYMGRTSAAFGLGTNGAAQLINAEDSKRGEFLWGTLDLTIDTLKLTLALRALEALNAEAFVRFTTISTATIETVTNDEVLRSLLTGAGIETDQVETSGVELDQVLYTGENVLSAARDMAGLGDGAATWRLLIYERGAEYSAWPTTPDWIIPRQWLETGEITLSRNQIYNAVRARLNNGWLSDWYEDAGSIARWGRREKTLPYTNVTELEAIKRVQLYLADNAEPIAGLRVEAKAIIERADGSRWPAAMMRAGDVVALRDWTPGSDTLIKVQETDYDGRRLRIVPAGGATRLELLLAKQQYQKMVIVNQSATVNSGGSSASGGATGGTGVTTHADLAGLDADDHLHYLNAIRHDTPDRHTLGTVVPHDAHSNLSGIGANDHHAQAHAIDGADHTAVGLVTGQMLRATAPTEFEFGALDLANINAVTGQLTDANIASAAAWNARQPAGNYITQLTSDVIANGPGSVPATLATVNSAVGTFGDETHIPVITADAKGRITNITLIAVAQVIARRRRGYARSFMLFDEE